jgi:hypothetical protein
VTQTTELDWSTDPSLGITVPDGKGLLHLMDRDAGDLRAMWDKNNPDEVAAARRMFEDLVGKKKYLAFKAEGKRGSEGEQLRTFDPAAERIIFHRQNKGG